MQFLYKIPGYILLLFGGFCLSWGGFIIRSFEEASIWQILFLRSFFFLLALIAFLFVTYKKNTFNIIKESGLPGLLGGFVLSFSFVAFVVAMSNTTVANVVFIISTQTMFLAIFGYLFIRSFDLISLKNFELTNDLKILGLKSAFFNYTDIQNKKNNFQAEQDGEKFIIYGKIFNASKLIEDLIFEDTKNKNIFKKNFSFKIDLDEVYLHDEDVVYDLKGKLNFIDNKIINANINAKFEDNDKVSFTLISKNNQKVTTFYSDRAKPFVKKFKFICQ